MELISVHIPKTAGTAFRRVLEQNYAYDALLLDYGDRVLDPASVFGADFEGWKKNIRQEVAKIPPSVRCVHGHFWAGKYAERFPSAKKIAWLRDPIQRLISHYFFWKNLPRSDHSLHQRMLDERMTLLDFAALPEMRDVCVNTFLRGYGIDDFDFFGIQEFFAEDLARFQKMMGWPTQPVSIENKTAAHQYSAFQTDADTLRKIEAFNEADVDLYRAALARRKRHVES